MLTPFLFEQFQRNGVIVLAACGAKTRSGGTCKNNAMPNGRCRLHGGKSTGPPKGNQNALKWGFWSKHVTPEQLAIMQEIDEFAPVDILWYNILVAYSAIIRAQTLMYVRDRDDHSDFQTKSGQFEEYERQWAWDKHAQFMSAQARAQSELRSLIREFVAIADETDTRRAKLALMQKEIEVKKLEIERLKNPDGHEAADDGFIDALKQRGSEVWQDDGGSGDDSEDAQE
ncbi:MAG: hypothetical protein K6T83_01095 [Alicyclobacillus sp.]|nr:hypothetical protein [Alicyclobacillus sp.]